MGTITKKVGKTKTTYQAMVRLANHPQLKKNFDTQAEAKEWIILTEAEIKLKGKANRSSLNKKTVEQILNEYETDNPDISRGKKNEINGLVKMMGSLQVEQLTKHTIQKFVDTLLKTEIPTQTKKTKSHKLYNGDKPKKTYSQSTVRRYYYTLKTAVEWWATKYEFDLNDRFAIQSIPKAWEAPRDRLLSKEEWKRLNDALNAKQAHKEAWKRLIAFGCETGMRTSEVMRLKVGSCFEQDRYLIIEKDTTKTKVSREVGLTKKAVEIVNEQRKSKKETDRLFSEISISGFLNSWRTLLAQAKIENFVYHDLRHQALTNMFKSDIPTMTIAKQSGHQQLETLKRYIKQDREFLIGQLDKMENKNA